MIQHQYYNILEYIPVRYTGLSDSQLQDRREVFNFKDGNASIKIKHALLSKIREIISTKPSEWVICFIPASTKARTFNRFSSIALFLSREAGCNVYIDAIYSNIDKDSGYITGKSNDPTQDFSFNESYFNNKKIILIDDVITRGRTFDDTAYKLEKLGAKEVIGLFIAKTIHPNLPQKTESLDEQNIPFYTPDDIPDDIFFDDITDDIFFDNIPDDIPEDILDEYIIENSLNDEEIYFDDNIF
jgi:hypothetical protein